MRFGSLDLNVKKGSTQIQKVMHGIKVVWENWKSMTGEIFKYNGGLSTSDSNSSGNTAKATAVLKYESVVRNLKGTMNISGAGGNSGVAQYGCNVELFTNEELTEYVEAGNTWFSNSGQSTYNFESPKDVPVYGLRYVVWTWNGGSGTSICTCKGAKVTSWQQKG